MIRELRHLLHSPLYWLLSFGVTGLSGTLTLFERRYRPETYWVAVGQFWDKIGLAAVVSVVLIVCLALISCDRTHRAEDIILTAAKGRKYLFWQRLTGCLVGVSAFTIIIAMGNFFCALLLAGGIPVPNHWWLPYLYHTLLAIVGGAGLCFVSCALCDYFRSQVIIITVMSIILLFSILSPDIEGTPAVLCFLANGFFAKLIRGRALTGWSWYSPPWGDTWWVWSLWHLTLATLCIFLAVRKRKERNQW